MKSSRALDLTVRTAPVSREIHCVRRCQTNETGRALAWREADVETD
jgi:hypothetical protein